jgi:uncharacterized sodium:solute symporter family permease YidK
LIASAFLVFGVLAIASAFFPGIDLRWGNFSSLPWAERIPLSAGGRTAFGLFALYLGAIMALAISDRTVWNVCIAVGALMLPGIYLIYLRDKRVFEGVNSRDDRTVHKDGGDE